MSSVLFLNNIHLGIELFGAIAFFGVGWLFAESFLLKKDVYSCGRALGFFLLTLWQGLHAVYDDKTALLATTFYIVGLALVLLSYVLEKMPPKPKGVLLVGAIPIYFTSTSPLIAMGLTGLTALVLVLRYFKDIDKLIKWLAIGFIFFALSSVISAFFGDEPSLKMWIAEHLLKVAGFAAIIFWGWQWLTLRLKDEVLIVFVSASLFIALLVTTVFSAFSAKRIEAEVRDTLSSNVNVLSFYLDSLKNKALASAQIIADEEDFTSSFQENNFKDLERIARELVAKTGGQFLLVARPNGNVVFKLNLPTREGENILSKNIGADALEGRATATIDKLDGSGLAVQGAAPLFYKGRIIGGIITGTLIDEEFVNTFKKISNLEVSVFVEGSPLASTIFRKEETLETTIEAEVKRDGKLVGKMHIGKQEVLGALLSAENIKKETVGVLAVTTTPGKLLKDSQATNRTTLLIILITVTGLIIPLYRFTLFIFS